MNFPCFFWDITCQTALKHSVFLVFSPLIALFCTMYEKTRGIVLYTLPYNDTLSVVHIYTERFGRVSYMLPRGMGRAAKMARALYMPLSLLDMEVEVRPGREMQRIREAHASVSLMRIQGDPVRSSLALFLAEFLGSVLRSAESQPQLFSYIARSVQLLDGLEQGLGNFHICFLIGLAPYMGITPNVEGYREGAYFDMNEGEFVMQRSLVNLSLSPMEAHAMLRLLRMNYANMHRFRFSRGERSAILDRIILYYGLHFTGMGQLSSPAVLHALFD